METAMPNTCEMPLWPAERSFDSALYPQIQLSSTSQLNSSMGYKATPLQIEAHLKQLALQQTFKQDPCNVF